MTGCGLIPRVSAIRLAGLALLALPFGNAAWAAGGNTAADAKFTAIYTREWIWRQAEFADAEDDTRKGISPHLPDVSPAAEARRVDYWNAVLTALQAIRFADLSPDQQTNYQVYLPQIEVLLNGQKFRDYEMPLNSDSAFWSDIVYTAEKDFTTEADYRNYIAQLNDIPRYFTEEIANMRSGLKRGFTPPQVTLAGRDASIASVVDAKTPEDQALYLPFKAMPPTIPAEAQAKLRAGAVDALQHAVVPAYARLLSFMRTDYVPGARATLAADDLPDGRAYYQAQIKEYTTTDLTAEQIHAIGLTEMAGIRAEMLAAMKDARFQGDLPAFLHFLRCDPQFYAKTPEELLMRAAFIAKEFDGKAAKYFGYLPRQRFGIRPVPADQAPFYTSGRGGPGVYLVNTYDLPARPLYSLTALTLHESAPGHAFQMPIALEHKEQPEFRQKVYISAYGEGWAVYAERLGTEMGMYHTPYETFGMLSYQAWRAARLVVDTGIHAQGWSREEAQAYLRDNTALSDHEIETEIDRYISWPGQALSYYLGELAIRRARAKAEAALGEKFNIRAFHDAVLELGSVPLPVLEARIDRFIQEGGKGPYPEMEN